METLHQLTKSNQQATEKVVIEIAHLKKSFGNQVVLKDISLQLFNGENLVVLGKSGTGKSVLIKCIVRLLSNNGGIMKIFGKDITTLNQKEIDTIREKIGFLFQGSALYDSMTVRQNLEFPLRRIKKELNKKEIQEKINEVLEQVGLPDSLDKIPSQLSGGMRKRISLARSIIVDPLIILYDEPTAGLDPITADGISNLILEVQKKHKTSSIIITHDIKCALKTANRIIMLEDGMVYQEGKKEDFIKSKDSLIKSFFK